MLYRTRFRIGQIINTKTGCSERIDCIHIDKDGIKYGGETIYGFSKGSRWGLSERELINTKAKVRR